MSLAVITVDNPSPAMETRAQEVQLIERALAVAALHIRKAGGANSSGTMRGDGGLQLGTWTYTAVAST